jgi:hypothetical protein
VANDPDGAPKNVAPPHGITLADHARISAQIAEGDRSLEAILAPLRLSEEAWNAATIHWMTRLGEETLQRGKDAELPHVYSQAFTEAQDAIKPLPPTDAASYAKLVVDVQLAGGPAQPLAARGLSNADYLRLSRHWARVLSSDPAQEKIFFDTYQRLQPSPSDEETP